MDERAAELIFRDSAQQRGKLRMQRMQEADRERYIGSNFGRRCPCFLIVSFYLGSFLGQCPFHADVSIHMAVGDVMYHLTRCPTSLAIRCLPLFGSKVLNEVFNLGRNRFDRPDEALTFLCSV